MTKTEIMDAVKYALNVVCDASMVNYEWQIDGLDATLLQDESGIIHLNTPFTEKCWDIKEFWRNIEEIITDFIVERV